MTEETNDSTLAKVRGAIIQNEYETKKDRHAKRSFWASDCLRPGIEIFWKWMEVPETNPIEPESLLLMSVGKMYELAIGEHLIKAGCAQQLNGEQARIEFDWKGAPFTGSMDFVHPEGYPIEIKSISTFGAMKMAKGNAPSDHYCHQLATYMYAKQQDKGLMIHCCRDNGALFESWMVHKGNGIYECKGYEFNLFVEFDRLRSLYTNHILTKIDPQPDYEYRPTITEALLANFVDSDSTQPFDKIKKAIKGERILSDHRWRPQYCNWRDLWKSIEAKNKGITVDELMAYTPADIKAMMGFLGVEEKADKNGKISLRKIKGSNPPCNKYLVAKAEEE
jgi:hypothetical protein